MVESGCFESNCMQIPGVRIPLCPNNKTIMKNGIVDLKKSSETSLLKDKRNPITMLVLMIFSSSNTYAMKD